MNLRKLKRDPADLLRQGEEIAAARNIDPRYKFRVAAANMALSVRCTVAQAAELAGAAEVRLANGWARTAGQEGSCLAERQEAQAAESLFLPAEQRKELKSVLKPGPKQFGCNVWDGITLSAYIKERFGSCASEAASTCRARIAQQVALESATKLQASLP